MIVIAMLALVAWGDSWLPPKKEKYFSVDKKFRVEVTPKAIVSQLAYFQDKVASAPNAGAIEKNRPSTAHAVLSERGALGRYARRASFALTNEVAPVSAIVSKDGQFIVTFDNWHAVGYGDDAVVIYRSNGSVVRKFSLEDLLTADDIATLRRTVSSILWGSGHYFNNRGQLVLRIVSNGKSAWGQDAVFHELRIDLESGQPVEPKRNLFPSLYRKPKIRLSLPVVPLPAISLESSDTACASDAQANFDTPGTINVASALLVEGLRGGGKITFPSLAKQAYVRGVVVADVLLNAQAKVQCARVRTGHPLFKAATLKGLLASSFDPAFVPGTTSYFYSTVTVNFELGQ